MRLAGFDQKRTFPAPLPSREGPGVGAPRSGGLRSIGQKLAALATHPNPSLEGRGYALFPPHSRPSFFPLRALRGPARIMNHAEPRRARRKRPAVSRYLLRRRSPAWNASLRWHDRIRTSPLPTLFPIADHLNRISYCPATFLLLQPRNLKGTPLPVFHGETAGD